MTGNTALHYAAMNDNYDICHYLLTTFSECENSLSIQNHDGRVPSQLPLNDTVTYYLEHFIEEKMTSEDHK